MGGIKDPMVSFFALSGGVLGSELPAFMTVLKFPHFSAVACLLAAPGADALESSAEVFPCELILLSGEPPLAGISRLYCCCMFRIV